MINIIIEDARKEYKYGAWIVLHPSSDALLAYCETEEEANAVIALLNQIQNIVNIFPIVKR